MKKKMQLTQFLLSILDYCVLRATISCAEKWSLISRIKQVDICQECQENTFLPHWGKNAQKSTKNQRFGHF
jgi:hypothetical protein